MESKKYIGFSLKLKAQFNSLAKGGLLSSLLCVFCSVSNYLEKNMSTTWDIKMAIPEDKQSQSVFEKDTNSA